MQHHAANPAGRASATIPPTAYRHFQEALSLQGEGRFEEAEPRYRAGLAIYPDHAAMLSNWGSVLDDMGRHDEAIVAYQRALQLHPGIAAVHNNLGLALQACRQHEQALASFQAAITCMPELVAAHFNLGRLLQMLGRHQAACDAYRQALKLAPNHAQAHCNLGASLESLQSYEASVTAYRDALQRDTGLLNAQHGLAQVLSKLVPAWHVPMMNDVERNTAYHEALKASISPGARVFEIGTGSGLLSMMAASLGAESVTTCEAEPLVAATAKDIIERNGLADRIHLIPKKSTEVELGKDLSEPATILVSEIFSSELLGERVLSSLEDAKRRLLAPDCRVIPASARIMVALVGGAALESNLRVEKVCGFDLSPFNEIVPMRQTVARNDLSVEMLSAGVPAFDFDFQNQSSWKAESHELRIPVTQSGRCLGIIQWIHLDMDGTTQFENHPSRQAAASSWTRCVYLLPQPVDIAPGQTAVVTASHNRTFPWFHIRGFES